MKYLLFVVLLFQFNLFAEQGAFLIVKDVKFAPFLKKTFFSGHNITSAKNSYDLEGHQIVLDEDFTFQNFLVYISIVPPLSNNLESSVRFENGLEATTLLSEFKPIST
jgi:hypothetical protein